MLNRVCLQGRFVADPDMRTTPRGTAVATSRLAVDRPKNKDVQENNCDFISVVFWGKTAEFVRQWFHKGDMAVIDGRIQTRDYTDKNGKRRYVTEVVAERVNFAASKRRDADSYSAPQQEFTELPPDDGELPF